MKKKYTSLASHTNFPVCVQKVLTQFSAQNAYLFVCLITIMLSMGCDSNKPPDVSSEEKIRVVGTIGMITDIAKNVGGEQVNVVGLMGPGVDPHLYKPTPKDIDRLNSANIIFYNGLHLEAKMADVLASMSGSTKTVAITDGIDKSLLLSSPTYQGQYDPHLWFDVTLWMKAVEKVRDTFIRTNAKAEATFRKNAELYLKELAELHEYVNTQTERIPSDQRVLVTAHDAFNYFGKKYRFEVRGLQGISTSTEVGIADVQELATFIASRKIPAIFVETSVSTRNLEAVQAAVKAKGFQVHIGGELFSDAMGEKGTPQGTYIGMVRHNIDTITQALLIRDNASNTTSAKED